MPEGDTLFRAARRVGAALTGHDIVALCGSHPAVSAWPGRVAGRKVTAVENVGKHLLIHVDGELALRTHLGMTGKWEVYRPGERWRKSAGKARLVIESADAVAVCFAAPDVEIGPSAEVLSSIAHLGPDLTADAFDTDEARARMQASDQTTVADLLLDQTVMAGVGNVFKSEILFLERLHPKRDPATLDARRCRRLVDRARRLLFFNRARTVRNTTGYSRKGGELWVYDRKRKPCRRCGTEVAGEEVGGRTTFWCPRCQT